MKALALEKCTLQRENQCKVTHLFFNGLLKWVLFLELYQQIVTIVDIDIDIDIAISIVVSIVLNELVVGMSGRRHSGITVQSVMSAELVRSGGYVRGSGSR